LARLADPSHVRCLGLEEWERVLTDAGFERVHSECMDKDMELDPWVERCCAISACTASCARAQPTPEPVLTLKEGIIVAKKPANLGA